MEAIAARLARRLGPAVTEWVAGLPDLVGRLATRWELTVGEPVDGGASSVVFRVTTADGRPAVLKVGPEPEFLAEQTAVLRLCRPSGRVPDVLASDVGAVLLSEIRPGTSAEDRVVPPAEYAELLRALHGVSLPEPGVLRRTLRGRVEEFLHRGIRQLADPALGAVLARSDFERALAELDTLLAGPAPVVLLHGDLHLGNVLDGGDRLMAIDPKACLGDPCFDAADYVVAGAGADGIESRVAGLAAEGFDGDRLVAWARQVAAMTVIPLARTGGRQRAVDELLELARA